MIVKSQCLSCVEKFEYIKHPRARGRKRKYCSSKCRAAAKREHNARNKHRYYIPVTRRIAVCIECGHKFKAGRHGAKCCSGKCRSAYHYKRYRHKLSIVCEYCKKTHVYVAYSASPAYSYKRIFCSELCKGRALVNKRREANTLICEWCETRFTRMTFKRGRVVNDGRRIRSKHTYCSRRCAARARCVREGRTWPKQLKPVGVRKRCVCNNMFVSKYGRTYCSDTCKKRKNPPHKKLCLVCRKVLPKERPDYRVSICSKKCLRIHEQRRIKAARKYRKVAKKRLTNHVVRSKLSKRGRVLYGAYSRIPQKFVDAYREYLLARRQLVQP